MVGVISFTEEEQAEALSQALLFESSRREARRLVDAQERVGAALPEILTLRERLARPREPVTYRIDGWQPAGTRVVLVAQFKAGKTTLVGNLARVLVDGGLFLGRDLVTPVEGAVGLLDFEMGAAQFDTWLADQKIVNDDRIVVVPLRGAASAFDILNPERRAEWAELLAARGVSYLVLDCLRPVLDALGLDEHKDAGRFLVAFDALLKEAGVPEATVVHHMGHAFERARGDSRIRDWPDVEWRLVRQDEDPAAPRYITAYGRDVDQPEAQLHFDPATRHLALVGGNRADAKARGALGAVLELLAATPDLSKNEIETQLAGAYSRAAVRKALADGVSSGQIATKPGPKNATLHALTSGFSSPASTAIDSPQWPRASGELVSAGQGASSPVRRDFASEHLASSPPPIGRRASAKSEEGSLANTNRHEGPRPGGHTPECLTRLGLAACTCRGSTA